ncbi:hypothetical protein Q8A73_002763 [Channa argus]|nr:hypothetical protein Q8A73_002763 [Channa argus]
MLRDLRKDDFLDFKWHLQQDDTMEGFAVIPEEKLKDAKRRDTVDMMVDMYTLPGAVEVAVKILKIMNRDNLVRSLCDDRSGSEELRQRPDSPVPEPRTCVSGTSLQSNEPSLEIRQLPSEDQVQQQPKVQSDQPIQQHPTDMDSIFMVRKLISLKLEIEDVMFNVVSGYAPQVGCELEEKEKFWSELNEVMQSISRGERVVIGADFNGHVGEGNRGDENVMGRFGLQDRNTEGQMVVDFAKRMEMAVVNTFFQKRQEHRVTLRWTTSCADVVI